MINLEKNPTASVGLTEQGAVNAVFNKYIQYKRFADVCHTVRGLMEEDLHISSDFWCLGGSWSMIGHGIDIGRSPHDVDVILDLRLWETFKYLLKLRPDIKIANHVDTSDYARLTIQYKGYFIDILCANDPKHFDEVYTGIMSCRIESLDHIIEVKSKWQRPKDQEDIRLIKKWWNDLQTALEKENDLPF